MKKQCDFQEKIIGPLILRNFRAFIENEPILSSFEYPLFTDAYITGELTEKNILGSYKLFNSLPNPADSIQLKPAIVLRIDYHLSNSEEEEYSLKQFELKKTKKEYYHAGNIQDEIASLLSLFLGIRVKSGNCCREFDNDGDPKGKPRGPKFVKIPILPQALSMNPILPKAIGKHCLNSTEKMFSDFFKLDDLDAYELIQSARYYQEAIWFSESFPNLSWLLFTSAIERAANYWKKSEKISKIEALKISQPNLFNELQSEFGINSVEIVAKHIGGMLKATKKFVDFLIKFCPRNPPNRERPPKYCRMNWKKSNLESVFTKIYDHRSDALHNCIPFPEPMCESPYPIKIKGKIKYEEIPWAEAYGHSNSYWIKKDVPILLYTFEYIVRMSILKWMDSMLLGKNRIRK
jgi:hypothetical protein